MDIVQQETSVAAYKTYVAIKNHFTSPYYDYFQYGGRVKAGKMTFERRNDKYFFTKLAKKKDIKGYLVANFIDNQSNWIGDVINDHDSDKIYTKWQARLQSLQYIFENDISKLDSNFDKNIIVVNGQHPPLLILALQKQISIETVIILNTLCKFFKHWSRSITDTVVWPSFKFKCNKYKPFFTFDEKRFRKIVVDKFE
jgi:hypothetical protein